MKKIMFSDKYGLTQAVLEDRKTMTRRVIGIDLYNQTDWKAFKEGNYECVVDGEGDWHDIRRCGAYHIGEEVAIAQSYRDILNEGDSSHIELCQQITSAYGLETKEPHNWAAMRYAINELQGYRNKMFVRADLMPHRIRITGIKVERLQDISSENCLREGIEARVTGCHTFYYIHGEERPCNFPQQAFAALIDKVSGRGTWDENPYVFAYTFETINP